MIASFSFHWLILPFTIAGLTVEDNVFTEACSKHSVLFIEPINFTFLAAWISLSSVYPHEHLNICTPEYNYYIKISSKETLDNLTESDYNEMIMDFEHKIKQYKIKNKIDALSKDFEWLLELK